MVGQTELVALGECCERCERADGPDRKLDLAIDLIVRPDEWSPKVRNAVEATCPDWFDDDELPPYTRSFDAALNVLPTADWEYSLEWQASSGIREMIAIVKVGDPMLFMEAEAASPALAMCAAALRARYQAPAEPTTPKRGPEVTA